MSPRSDWLRLKDIAHAISKLQTHLAEGKEAFLSSESLQDAISWNLAVIGEAANDLSDETKEMAPDVPWDLAIRMRDFLIHHYFTIDPEIVWSTLEKDLPQLDQAVQGLLAKTQQEIDSSD